MELTPRKQAILAAIVKYHIATGSPVGSKWLTTSLENAPSSATLRNEMSQLSNMGLLYQPHTSAGRIPTGKGYEFYVSNLMKSNEIGEREKAFIDTTLEKSNADSEILPTLAAKLLSKITGLPAFVAKVADESAVIKRVQIMPMSSHLIMTAISTSDGRTKSKLCRSASPISEGEIAGLYRLIKECVEGKPLYELSAAAMQNMYAQTGLDALSLMPLIASLFDMIKEMGQSQIQFSGEMNIYSMLESSEKAGKLISFLERKEGIMSLISQQKDSVGVIFGGETGFSELSKATVIVAPYGPKNLKMGRIGVIGPTRMSYAEIVPGISYLAERLTEILNESIKDMEE